MTISLGYNLGTYGDNHDGVDGECGSKTVDAIEQFQEKHGLEVDGEYGPKTHAKLQEVIADGSKQDDKFQIRVTGGSVNIRSKPNTATGKIIRVARKNNVLDAVDVDAATGWYRLDDGNYISNKYAEIMK